MRTKLVRAGLVAVVTAALLAVAGGPAWATATVTFASASNFPAGTSPAYIVSADFDGDGNPDLATANFGSGNVSVLLGDGSGGFGAARDFPVGSLPVGITSADFDGDGKLDLATANAASNDVSVLLGDGSGGFGAAQNFAAGSGPFGITSADFDGDGNPDLAVKNADSNDVSVLLGDGSGGFGAAQNFAAGSGPFGITSADFDGDGELDLAVTNDDSDNVSVLVGDGSGGFGAAQDFPVGSAPEGITSADFDGDGNPDLATANNGSDNVSVLLNTTTTSEAPANDNFASAQQLTGTSATGTNNGATKEAGEPNHYNNPGGKSVWYRWTPQASGTATIDTAGGDFDTLLAVYTGSAVDALTEVASNDDADGGLQSRVSFAATAGTTYRIAVDGYNNGTGPASGNITLNLGTPDTTPPDAPVIDSPADNSYDTDGNITISGTAEANSTVEIFDGSTSKGTATANASGNWSKTLTGVSEGTHTYTAKATDADGNTSSVSNARIMIVDTTAPTVSGVGPQEDATDVDVSDDVTATFSEAMNPSTLTGTTFTLTKQGDTSPVTALVTYDSTAKKATLNPSEDLEADTAYTATVESGSGGVKDSAGNALAEDEVWSFTTAAPDTTPPGTVTFASASDIPSGRRSGDIVSADFDGDGNPDLATATGSVVLGDGSGGFGAPTYFAASGERYGITSADFDGDGNPDLAVTNKLSSNVSVVLGDGSGGFGATQDFRVGNNLGFGSAPEGIISADFDGDGNPDLATASFGSSAVSVVLGDGSGDFGTYQDFLVGLNSAGNPTNPLDVTSADFDGDGKLDLAVSNYDDVVSVLLGNGDGAFQTAQTFDARSGYGITSADLDGDGNPDLATATGSVLGDGSGGFGAAQDFDAGSGPEDITSADFEGDGNPDLATANNDSDNVSVLINDGSGAFGAAQNLGVGDGPNGITSPDFDGDGNPDLATANRNSTTVSVLLNTTTAAPPDTTPPETTITAGPSGTTNSTSASFEFSSSETGSTFECSLDDATFGDCTSPKDYTDLPDGEHTFEVRATDAASNEDQSPASSTWTVDTAAPDAPTIDSPADNSYDRDGNITVTGTAEADSTIELFDGTTSKGTTTADASGNWSKTLTGVTEGTHAYTAKATDQAGNTSAASDAVTVTVDTRAPNTTIDSGPSGTTNSRSASFTFSSSETGSTFRCRLDGAAFGSCTSPKAYSNLTDGQHTFRVEATDRAGNPDPTPASHTWTIDATAPTVTNVSPQADETDVAVSEDVTATFSEAMDPGTLDGTTFTLTKQGDASPVAVEVTYDAATMQATLDPSEDLEADATYTATIIGGTDGVRDTAGNPLAADEVWSFTTAPDTTPPETTITAGPSGTTSSRSARFEFESSEAGSTFRCRLDAAFGSCTSPKDYANLSDGEHTFEVKATDRAGNADSTPATRTWTVDTAAPSASVITSPADNSYDRDGNITLSGTAEANSTVELFDGTTSKGTTTADASGNWSKTLTGVAEGSHTYTAKAVDAAGNTSGASNAITVIVDTTAPTVSSVMPADKATNVARNTNVTATFSEGMDPNTLTGSTVTLVKVGFRGSTTPVTATVTVSSDGKTVTIDPSTNLGGSATYRATIKGKPSGGEDLAGNPLADDKIWSFKTGFR